MTDSSNLFPNLSSSINEDGLITKIPDEVVLQIINRLEARFAGSFDPEEVSVLKGLIYICYNKSQKQSESPSLQTLIENIDRTAATLAQDDQIRKFKALKQKLENIDI